MTQIADRLADIFTRERHTKPGGRLWRSPSALMSTAREPIDENTTISYSAVWRALELLSGVMARMPKALVREIDEANKVLVSSHRVSSLLTRSVSPEQTSPKWFEQTTMLTALWGQSFSEIVVGGKNGMELFPLHPSRTRVVRDQRTDLLTYEYTAPTGGVQTLQAEEVLHVTMPSPDGITGRGLMSLAKDPIGLALALQKYGGALFGNNAIPGLVLEHPNELGEPGEQNLRDSIEARHRGAGKAHTPLILEEGMKASTLTPPNDSMQFNETRGFQVVDIARYLGVPPHLLYWLDRATFSNIEHLGIEFVKYTLGNWISRFSSEMQVKLLPNEPNLKIEFDTSEIEKGDSETFSKVQERRLQNGIISFNEARRALGLNSLGPEGDARIVNSTFMLAERLNDEPQPAPDVAPAAAIGTDDVPEPDANEGDDEQERARQAAAIVLRESMESLIGIECDRVERALKKSGDSAERVTKFYEGFAERVAVAFTPAFSAHAAFTGADQVDIVGLADEYVETHRGLILQELAAGRDPAGVIEEWRDSRADHVTALYFGGSDDGA